MFTSYYFHVSCNVRHLDATWTGQVEFWVIQKLILISNNATRPWTRTGLDSSKPKPGPYIGKPTWTWIQTRHNPTWPSPIFWHAEATDFFIFYFWLKGEYVQLNAHQIRRQTRFYFQAQPEMNLRMYNLNLDNRVRSLGLVQTQLTSSKVVHHRTFWFMSFLPNGYIYGCIIMD